MNNVQELLEKQLSRREFLMHFGAIALAVIGVSGILNNIMQSVGSNKSVSNGAYGFSAYSGKSTKSKS